MNPELLARWAAIPAHNRAHTAPDLIEQHAALLRDIVDQAENSRWGLSGRAYVSASLLYLYAQAELARDALDRELAGARMKAGRLEKRVRELETRSKAELQRQCDQILSQESRPVTGAHPLQEIENES